MTKEILRSCLKQDFYAINKLKLSEDLFEAEQKEIFKIIRESHSKYSEDLSFPEITSLWMVNHPVATHSEKEDFQAALSHIEKSEEINPEVASDLINEMWKHSWARKGAELFLRISEGNADAEQSLEEHLRKKEDGFSPDDFAEAFVTKDIELLIEQASDDHRYKFNISSLRNIVCGVGKKEFGCIFAVPEAGKTAFVASICVAPEGFVHQGAKTLILVNEEDGGRTMLRSAQALCGVKKDEVKDNIAKIKSDFIGLGDQFEIANVGGYDFNKIEAIIASRNPDVVCIDQADKVHIKGSFNASHEKLRALYTNFRELAKRQDIALLVVSQASQEAQYKTKLTPFDMENSKIGKAAEVDLLIGISKHPKQENEEPDYTRFLSVCKNKLSGIHSTAVCFLNHEISRYED
tara:strand:+ start:2114 stop:3334 length:1221 start_codon:yes stop_codon:yes gene_type:complete